MFYNLAKDSFYLTSVDAKGNHWVLSGGLDRYVITSEARPHPRGASIMIRSTHTNILPDSFEALTEMPRDGARE